MPSAPSNAMNFLPHGREDRVHVPVSGTLLGHTPGNAINPEPISYGTHSHFPISGARRAAGPLNGLARYTAFVNEVCDSLALECQYPHQLFSSCSQLGFAMPPGHTVPLRAFTFRAMIGFAPIEYANNISLSFNLVFEYI